MLQIGVSAEYVSIKSSDKQDKNDLLFFERKMLKTATNDYYGAKVKMLEHFHQKNSQENEFENCTMSLNLFSLLIRLCLKIKYRRSTISNYSGQFIKSYKVQIIYHKFNFLNLYQNYLKQYYVAGLMLIGFK